TGLFVRWCRFFCSFRVWLRHVHCSLLLLKVLLPLLQQHISSNNERSYQSRDSRRSDKRGRNLCAVYCGINCTENRRQANGQSAELANQFCKPVCLLISALNRDHLCFD